MYIFSLFHFVYVLKLQIDDKFFSCYGYFIPLKLVSQMP